MDSKVTLLLLSLFAVGVKYLGLPLGCIIAILQTMICMNLNDIVVDPVILPYIYSIPWCSYCLFPGALR